MDWGELQSEKWKNYPLDSVPISVQDDLHYSRQQLEQNRGALFVADPSKIRLETWVTPTESTSNGITLESNPSYVPSEYTKFH